MKKRILLIGVVGIVIAAFVIMFYPKPRPDLAVFRMSVEPSNVEIGQYFEADAWVRNIGKGKSGNFRVKVYFHSPFYDDYTLGDISVNGLRPNEEKNVFSRDDLRLWDLGAHQLVVEIIPLDFSDKDYTNNDKEYEINVFPPLLPDLVFYNPVIVPFYPKAHEKFIVNVDVKNDGIVASGNYDVRFYICDETRTHLYIISEYHLGPLLPGEIEDVYYNDMVEVGYPGKHELHLEIIPLNFNDADDNNNVQVISFYVNP